MAKQFHVEGHAAFKSAVEENSGKTIFALFTGSIEEGGKSWCPDCVTADPVVEANLPKLPDDAVYIHCSVGNRAFWKDMNNEFRKDPELRLKSVPTLMKIGQPKRLEEDECAKSSLVEMLFTDE